MVNVAHPTVLLWKLITVLLDIFRKFLLMKHPWFIWSWEVQWAQWLIKEEVISCTRRSTCIWNVAFIVFPGPYDAFLSPKKCDLLSTCILCATGKYYFQTYKYLYIYYTTSLMR